MILLIAAGVFVFLTVVFLWSLCAAASSTDDRTWWNDVAQEIQDLPEVEEDR